MDAEVKVQKFKRWVLWTGIFNIVAYSPLVCPFTLKHFLNVSNKLSQTFGLGGTAFTIPQNINNLLMINLVGLFVIFFGIWLIIASFDIANRAWFVFYEGLIRILVFFIFLYFVIFNNAAVVLIVFGTIDLIFNCIYMYYIFSIQGLRIK
ncbi:MAG: hypothetical protein U5R49_26395 [Deltaproteobacteria bacterium]|nr:hypothetical protein [Deltaproteobacteria bacterium]